MFINTGISTTIPSGLVELEYIQSSGTQYIDTGFKPNQDTRLEMVCSPLSVVDANDGSGFIPYGAGESYTSRAFECYTVNSQYEFNYDGQYGFIGSSSTGQKLLISHNKNEIKLIIDGSTTLTKSFNYQSFTAPYTMTLFAIHRSSVIRGLMKLYACQIYDNGTLIRDYIPAKRISDGKCGLWDKVNFKFYTDESGGNFTAGAEKTAIAAVGTPIEYIQSTGTQYIDTGFKPNQNTRVVMDVTPIDVSLGKMWCAFGVRQNDIYFGLYKASTGNMNLTWFYGSNYSNYFTVDYAKRHNLEVNKNAASVDGISKSYAAQTFQFTIPLFLLCDNAAGSPTSAGAALLYSCQIYDNGTLIRDFIPCKNASGVVGMWDDVNSVFYQNAGTGTFTAGPTVTLTRWHTINGVWSKTAAHTWS